MAVAQFNYEGQTQAKSDFYYLPHTQHFYFFEIQVYSICFFEYNHNL